MKLFITCALAAAAVVALGAPARAQVGGGYYAAPAPWWGEQRYGIPSGPQCRSNTGIRRPGWCGGPRYDGSYGPQPADVPLPPPGGAYPPVSYPLAYAPLPPPSDAPPLPPLAAPPPLGWVYRYYAPCADPNCSTLVVAVSADGLNVRPNPNAPAFLSLANGTPLVPLQRQGDWVLVAPACPLGPTGAWSWTNNVPLSACL